MKKRENLATSNPETVTISRAEYEEKNARLAAQDERISRLENQIEMLLEALRLARHKQFGASSEKSEDTLTEQLSFLFNEAEVFAEAQAEDDNGTEVKAHKRHKKHEYALDNIPEGIPTKQVEHRLEGEDLVCPECGDTMTEIGKEVVRTIELIPAKAVVREDIYYTYACKSCAENADEGSEAPIVKTPKEKNIIPGSFTTPEAITHIMTQKFVMGSPLYRQEQEINRKGIQLSRQTMSNWILKAAEVYLTPVYEQLHEELLKRDALHADETTLQVLHEPGKKPESDSYMWLYRTGGDTDKPIVLYEYQPGRGAKHPKEFLAGYKGYLHLFAIEQGLAEKNATTEERYTRRLEQAKPVLDALLSWAYVRTAAPKSALGKALTYLREQWPYLTNYLKDGRLEISNNRAERSIKPFVIDRKNFLFANTPKGATGSAIMFSLIQTSIENGLDPYKYLTWLMKTAKDTELSQEDTIHTLLPWNAPAECRSARKDPTV